MQSNALNLFAAIAMFLSAGNNVWASEKKPKDDWIPDQRIPKFGKAWFDKKNGVIWSDYLKYGGRPIAVATIEDAENYCKLIMVPTKIGSRNARLPSTKELVQLKEALSIRPQLFEQMFPSTSDTASWDLTRFYSATTHPHDSDYYYYFIPRTSSEGNLLIDDAYRNLRRYFGNMGEFGVKCIFFSADLNR